MILLHGTSLRRWEQIRTHGFFVSADPEKLGTALAGHVSFGNLSLAGYHAEFRAYWDNYPSSRDKINPPVLLALDISRLQDHLQVDPAAVKMPFENLLGASRADLQARWAASAQQWQDSLSIFGAVSLPSTLIESLVCLPLEPVGSPGADRDSTGLGFAGQILNHTNVHALWTCSHAHENFELACACATASINRRRLLQHPLRAALSASGLNAQQLRDIGQNLPLPEIKTLV